MIRRYLMPIIGDGVTPVVVGQDEEGKDIILREGRRPAFFEPVYPHHLFNYACRHFPDSEVTLVKSDVPDDFHAAISKEAGVFAFPENDKELIGDPAPLQSLLSEHSIPSAWITSSMTAGEVWNRLLNMIQFYQTTKSKQRDVTLKSLSASYDSLDVVTKAAVLLASNDFGLPLDTFKSGRTVEDSLNLVLLSPATRDNMRVK